MSLSLAAQQPPAAAGPAAGPSSSSSLSSSLGVYVFPAQNQTTQQQSSDEGSCFGWAKSQTGFDPMAIKPQQASAPQTSTATAGGAPVKGAVAGAAGGAAIGAIAGDAGKGAAIGATTGVLAGAAAKRHARKEAAAEHQQEQQQEQQQAQASVAQQKATYNKAFSACMQGKGYTVN
ncbi:MAG: hypothetical protein JO299_18440 [Gammaproteobacteria bacterium]|nr:hypothetical protein [Gammaproteobacteria bacterium]